MGVGGTLGAVALTNGFGTDDTVADANDTADQPSVEPEPAAPSTEADPTPDLPSPSPSPAELTVDDFDVETSVLAVQVVISLCGPNRSSWDPGSPQVCGK